MVLAGVVGAAVVGAVVPVLLCALLARRGALRSRTAIGTVERAITAVEGVGTISGSGLRFSTAGSPDELLESLVAALALPTDRPKLTPAIYLQSATDDVVVICLGNFVEPELMRAELRVHKATFPGLTKGTLSFFEAAETGAEATSTEVDRLVPIADHVSWIRHTIGTELVTRDPHTMIVDDRVSPDVAGDRAA